MKGSVASVCDALFFWHMARRAHTVYTYTVVLYQTSSLLAEETAAWSSFISSFSSVYTRHCTPQSNRSISLHVQKLICVNIYPEKCFDSVGSLKTCSSARPKTIQVIPSLYVKGVGWPALFDCQRQRCNFESHKRGISYIVAKFVKEGLVLFKCYLLI